MSTRSRPLYDEAVNSPIGFPNKHRGQCLRGDDRKKFRPVDPRDFASGEFDRIESRDKLVVFCGPNNFQWQLGHFTIAKSV